MNHRGSVSVGDWFIRTIRGQTENSSAQILLPSATLQFKFLPWFSIAGFSTVALFCIVFGTVLSHVMTREILDHDTVLTSQFISGVESVQIRQAHLEGKVSLGQLLDERTDFAALGVDARLAADVRRQYYEHIRMLPDQPLATVFAPDRTIIWSTNAALIGKINEGNDELEQAIASHRIVTSNSFSGEHEKKEQQFSSEPGMPFVESYIPLLDLKGNVAAVVEVYQEPRNLLQTIHHGKLLIWACIALGAAFLYIAPFWIFRRVDNALNEQLRRLREAEALCVVGEMSAAVAHGIRNPLATIRSSAELALDAPPDAARKNACDIIAQVDRLGKWVRDLLIFSRPVSGEREAVNLLTLVNDCLYNFAVQLEKSGISYECLVQTEPLPMAIANRALAYQALASVISNAIEAMPNGGSLRLQLHVSAMRNHINLTVSDSGVGMSPSQIDLAFKPFYTTKTNGVGLGMPQVKRIMERYGGSVSLRSRQCEGTQACLSFLIA